MQVNPNEISNIHVELPRDLFQLKTFSYHMLDDVLMTTLAGLILIQTVSRRDTVMEVLDKEEPGSYKLFLSSSFYHAFV